MAEEYRTKFRDSVTPHLKEDVLAVGTFRTTGSGTKFAISKLQAGAAVYAAASKLGRARAGDLPNTFLLAVDVKEEVGAWDRAGLQVGTEPMATTTRVRLEWPDGDKIVCDEDGMGDNPWADDVLRVLQAA